MDMSTLAAAFMAMVAAGGLAYVFIYPLLSGEVRAEKRQKALVTPVPERRGDRGLGAAVNRREQVAQSLKEIEAREKAKHRVTIENRITQAGLNWTKGRFLIFSAVAGLVLGVVSFAGTGNPYLALAAAFIGGFGLPRWVLSYLKNRRIKQFVNELPNAIDVVVRGIRAGLPLADCIRIIATEAQDPLRSEFRMVVESQALGISMGEALTKLYDRVPVAEANFLAIVITIQQKAGGNLGEALGNLSRVLRERKKMKGKIQAMSMEAKASAAIIAALPFTVAFLTYLSSPRYIELLWTTQTGKLALVASGMWMMVGLFTMKKMISFDI